MSFHRTAPQIALQAMWALAAPGLVFQAVVIGGGYATGRELVQFFMGRDPATGLLGMLVAACVWGAVMAVALELARIRGARDYRMFLKRLIGPFWVAYEWAYVALLLLVLAVLAAAAGEISHAHLGVSPLVGQGAMLIAMCGLLFCGTPTVRRFLILWSVLLYALFGIILVLCLVTYGKEVPSKLIERSPSMSGAVAAGIAYAAYNVAVVPGILYCGRHLNSRRQTLVAGGLAGLIAMFPGVLFFLALLAFWPAIRTAPVPVDVVLISLRRPWLLTLFYAALFGVSVKTGTALVHALNERIAGSLQGGGKRLSGSIRALVGAGMMIAAGLLAGRFGIIALVAKGYSALTVVFLVIFVLPLLTKGIWSLVSSPGRTPITSVRERE